MYDEDGNDGKFPDESLVEVRYPRSKQEEQADRDTWPWLPGSIVEQCGPDEWYCAMAGGHRAARPAVTSITRAASGTARRSGRAPHPAVPPRRRGAGQAGDRRPGDPLRNGGGGLRRGRLRGSSQLFPHLRTGPGVRPGRHGGPAAAR
jgi:hypothetical protein